MQASDGQYLGTTEFTYVDEDQEVLRRFITSARLQAKFFAFLAQELKGPQKSETDEEKAISRCSCKYTSSNFSLVSRNYWHRDNLIGRQTVAGLFADGLFMVVKTERVTVYLSSVYLAMLDSLDKRQTDCRTSPVVVWLTGWLVEGLEVLTD